MGANENSGFKRLARVEADGMRGESEGGVGVSDYCEVAVRANENTGMNL